GHTDIMLISKITPDRPSIIGDVGRILEDKMLGVQSSISTRFGDINITILEVTRNGEVLEDSEASDLAMEFSIRFESDLGRISNLDDLAPDMAKPVDRYAIEPVIKILGDIDEPAARDVLEQLLSSQSIRAPPFSLLSNNYGLRAKLKEANGVFNERTSTIFLYEELLSDNNRLFVPTLIRLAVEASIPSGVGQDEIDMRIRAAQEKYLEYSYNPEVMGARINKFVGSRRNEMFNERSSRQNVDPIIDELNSRETLTMEKDIDVAPLSIVEDFQDDGKAINALLSGELCLQMPFAGQASRMYDSLKKALKERRDALEAAGVPINEKDFEISPDESRIANIDIWDIAFRTGLISEIPPYAQRINVGERAMLALEQGIFNLARTH
ncbi:MAG TPA: hypothetical protein PLV52_07545, partial [Candidatus Omnitrophota bacterium]|nr:hypothetical protein [Candidatus Omnitrophota bacterium]